MIDRRHFLATASLGGTALGFLVGARSARSAAPVAGAPASDRLNGFGPEARMLQRRVGLWDVTETLWARPGDAPTTSRGLVAERVMIGSALQEFIRPPADTARVAVKRTDLLCFNRLDGRWDYLSFDTRAPVGLMPAWSLGVGDLDRIEVSFAPFAVPGAGTGGTGQMLRMRQEILGKGAAHDVKDQFFTLADGTATEWLAHRYDYVRRA